MYVTIEMTIEKKDSGVAATVELIPYVPNGDDYIFGFAEKKLQQTLAKAGVTADKISGVANKGHKLVLRAEGDAIAMKPLMENILSAFDVGDYRKPVSETVSELMKDVLEEGIAESNASLRGAMRGLYDARPRFKDPAVMYRSGEIWPQHERKTPTLQ